MIATYLFIMALVMPDGEITVAHSFVNSCPSVEEVTKELQPLKDKGDILGWGGKCERIQLPTRI